MLRLTPWEVSISAQLTRMNTILKLVFCADVILIPTPFYGVIVEDVKLYSDVNLYHVPLDCEVRKQDTYFAVQFDLWSV